jgi:hypothetical protein
MPRPDTIDPVKWRQIMAIKVLHSAILLGMSTAVLYVLYCGLTGRHDAALWIAIGLVSLESAVFLFNRSRCPLTTLAIELGDTTGNDFLSDRLLPKAWIRYTVPVCGGLYGLGLATLAVSAIATLVR